MVTVVLDGTNHQVSAFHFLKQPPVSNPRDIVIERVELVEAEIGCLGGLQLFIKLVGAGQRCLYNVEYVCKRAQCMLSNWPISAVHLRIAGCHRGKLAGCHNRGLSTGNELIGFASVLSGTYS